MKTETHGDHEAHKYSGVQSTGHAHAVDSMSSPDQPTDAKPFTDPVCGMKVGSNPEREITFDGELYHFCSSKCMGKFEATPENYVGKLGTVAPAPAPTPEGSVFTCPMHPEIRQPAPGTCPICGMALEPEMPSLEDAESPELVDFRRRFWLTLPLTVIVFVLAMFGHMLFPGGLPSQNWIEFALSTPVVLWAGWPFFERCIQSLRRMSPNMCEVYCQ